jgi:prevent-host-death family protein
MPTYVTTHNAYPSYDAGAARVAFAEVLSRAQYAGERVVVLRRGRPVAAVVPIADLNRLIGGGPNRIDSPPPSAA